MASKYYKKLYYTFLYITRAIQVIGFTVNLFVQPKCDGTVGNFNLA